MRFTSFQIKCRSTPPQQPRPYQLYPAGGTARCARVADTLS